MPLCFRAWPVGLWVGALALALAWGCSGQATVTVYCDEYSRAMWAPLQDSLQRIMPGVSFRVHYGPGNFLIQRARWEPPQLLVYPHTAVENEAYARAQMTDSLLLPDILLLWAAQREGWAAGEDGVGREDGARAPDTLLLVRAQSRHPLRLLQERYMQVGDRMDSLAAGGQMPPPKYVYELAPGVAAQYLARGIVDGAILPASIAASVPNAQRVSSAPRLPMQHIVRWGNTLPHEMRAYLQRHLKRR